MRAHEIINEGMDFFDKWGNDLSPPAKKKPKLSDIKVKFPPAIDPKLAKMIQAIAASDASPEHKKAAIDALMKKQGVAEGTELLEYRQSYLKYLQSWFPDWPDYVIRDWLYPMMKNMDQSEMNMAIDDIADAYPVYSWQLKTLDLSLDAFDSGTQSSILAREGGLKNPRGVPRDAERHAVQAQKIQQTGAASQEPIIVIQRPDRDGLELVEGWHRTIQNIKAFPNGYRGRAWVGYTE